jgi:activator of HSP90 ATPase
MAILPAKLAGPSLDQPQKHSSTEASDSSNEPSTDIAPPLGAVADKGEAHDMNVDTNSSDMVAVEAFLTSHDVGVDPLTDFLLDEGSISLPLLLEPWTLPQLTILFPVSLSYSLA